jgi:gamma-glutamylcyclotransferase (GGCT)/AIG2-like uncharacterized protein YtfP
MTSHLFVYGTLLPHRAPAAIAPALGKLRTVGEGTVPGYLYDLGEYPGAIVDKTAKASIHGTVFAMPGDEEFRRTLDEYEGYDPRNASFSLFLRRVEAVRLAAGPALDCWMYVYNRGLRGAKRIPGGRYGRQ